MDKTERLPLKINEKQKLCLRKLQLWLIIWIHHIASQCRQCYFCLCAKACMDLTGHLVFLKSPSGFYWNILFLDVLNHRNSCPRYNIITLYKVSISKMLGSLSAVGLPGSHLQCKCRSRRKLAANYILHGASMHWAPPSLASTHPYPSHPLPVLVF